MSAPENLPAGGPRGSDAGVRPTVLAWLASLGLYWPVWLWRMYSGLQRAPGATRVSPGRAAGLAVLPAVNLIWTVMLSVDLPRAVRRARSGDGSAPPDTEMLTILLLAPLAAGLAVALVLGLSPLLAVLAAGYLAWPFEVAGAVATERAMGRLRPALEPRQRRRHVAGALAAGAVGGTAVAVALAADGNGGTKTIPTPTAPAAELSDVSDIASTSDALWITNSKRGTVIKLDPRTRRRAAPPIPVGREPIDVGAREDGVWVADYRGSTVRKIDPATNRLGRPVETGRGPFGIAVTRDAVWVTNQVERTVNRVDPRDGKVVGRPVLVGRGPRGIAVGEGAVWVATGEGNGVSTFPVSAQPRRAETIRLGRFCHDVAVAGGSVWVTNPNESQVTRIDPDTKRAIKQPITVPGPGTIEAGFGLLWVASEAGSVIRIDPRTGTMRGRPIDIPSSISDLTIGENAVWVLRSDGKVSRLPPR
jgi:DNA-binding beta-propeller fold protein YncE